MGDAAKELLRRILSANRNKPARDPALKPAGIMVLLLPADGEYRILLNKRTHQVEHHKDEISFPGGARDGADKTLLETALRETSEEMGILPEDVDVLGELDEMPTRSHFLMSPYVGTIPYPYRFQPSEAEVAEVLEVPLSALKDEENLRDEIRIVDAELVSAPVYAYEGHIIFGATAQVLYRFLKILDSAPDKETLW